MTPEGTVVVPKKQKLSDDPDEDDEEEDTLEDIPDEKSGFYPDGSSDQMCLLPTKNITRHSQLFLSYSQMTFLPFQFYAKYGIHVGAQSVNMPQNKQFGQQIQDICMGLQRPDEMDGEHRIVNEANVFTFQEQNGVAWNFARWAETYCIYMEGGSKHHLAKSAIKKGEQNAAKNKAALAEKKFRDMENKKAKNKKEELDVVDVEDGEDEQGREELWGVGGLVMDCLWGG